MPCPNCAVENPPNAAFCGRCGGALAPSPPPAAQPQLQWAPQSSAYSDSSTYQGPPPQGQYAPPPPPPQATLFCVSGSDAGKWIIVGGQVATLGTSLECGLLSDDADVLPVEAEFVFQNGQMHFRSSVNRPLFLNGAPAPEGVLPIGGHLRVGRSFWQVAPPNYGYAPPRGQARPNTPWFQTLNQRVGDFTGTGPVEGLDARDLFSEVFHKRADEDVEEYFMVGTRSTTPDIETVRAVWPKPWVFFRIFTLALLVYIGFNIGVEQFHNLNCLPGLIIIGSFAIPLTVVIFYFEMNVPRNVSFYQVFKALLVGGIFSLIITLFSGNIVEGTLRLPLPGLVEEFGKASVLLLFVHKPKYRWTLNGLLLGGAIGAGFAGFESAGYALHALLSDGSVQQSIFLRGVLAPGGHVAWAALEGAALWKVKGDLPFRWEMLHDIRFLRVLGLSIVLHTVWDLPLLGIPLPEFLYLPLLGVLSIIAWVAILGFIQDGLKQIQAAQAEREKIA